MLCSILLVDEATQTFKAGVDVNDAKNFSLESSGVSILPPYVGPCCKAANLGEVVVTTDIASDQAWQNKWKDWALANNLRSCRSHPILSSTGSVLGTFAMYHKSHAAPTLASLYQVELVTHIAGIAIERKLIEARELEWRKKIEGINLELSNSIKLRDDFLSIASHELNSPLATMKMRTTLEKENILEGEGFSRTQAVKLLESYESQIDRVLNLVLTLTDVSYLESQEQKLNCGLVDLHKVMRNVTERLRPLVETSGCVMSLNMDDDVCGIWDEVRLEQVVTNLITNAVKYGGHGKIGVELRRRLSGVQIMVQDEGPGIAPEDRERIFRRYERLSSRHCAHGLGLGLYIVREIARAHGGDVRVDSVVTGGARFTVELPYNGLRKAALLN